MVILALLFVERRFRCILYTLWLFVISKCQASRNVSKLFKGLMLQFYIVNNAKCHYLLFVDKEIVISIGLQRCCVRYFTTLLFATAVLKT